jgi:predicted permease
MSYNLRMHGYPDERAAAFHAALLDRVRSTANVRSATLATLVPLGGRVWVTDLTLPGRPRDPDARPERIGVNHVWPAFFDTMDIRIVKGRPLGQADMVSPVPLSAVVSETMARRFWPDGDPIGERFSVDGPEGPFVDVVGVARDVLTDEFTERPWPFVYLPGRRTGDDVALIAHVAGDAGAALRAIEAQLRTLDSSVAVFEPMTLGQHIARRLDGERALSRVLSLAGLLALGLAALGLYGLVAYTVARRTREIGIRVALGAQPADIVRLFVTDALRISLVGLVAGTPPAVGVTALLAGSLVGVGMIDVSTMSGAMLVLAVVTLAAAYLPARRATRVDAIVALRSE